MNLIVMIAFIIFIMKAVKVLTYSDERLNWDGVS